MGTEKISNEFETFNATDKLNLEKALRTFYDTTSSIRFFILSNSSVFFFNRKAGEELPYVIGKKIKMGVGIKKLLKKSDIQEDFLIHFQRAIRGEHTTAEYLMGTCDQRMWHKIEYYPVEYNMEIIGVSVSIWNINNRKQKDQLLLHKNNVLKDIVYTQSHIVRAPLSNILGLIPLFNKLELSKENIEVLDLLEVAAIDLDEVIKEITAKAYEEPAL